MVPSGKLETACGVRWRPDLDLYACSRYVVRFLSKQLQSSIVDFTDALNQRNCSALPRKEQIPSDRTRVHVAHVVIKVRNTDPFTVIVVCCASLADEIYLSFLLMHAGAQKSPLILLFFCPAAVRRDGGSYRGNTKAAQDGNLNRTPSLHLLFFTRKRNYEAPFKIDSTVQ